VEGIPSPELSPFGSGLIVPPALNKLGETMAAEAVVRKAWNNTSAAARTTVAVEHRVLDMESSSPNKNSPLIILMF
jgi:hypothetical protein